MVAPESRTLELRRIWPISLSANLPSTVQLDGFDITDAQFPPKQWLPTNVRLEKWNIHESVPEYLLGQYDVVNIRYFALVVRKDNLSRLLRNLISLLKPGGYLQWIEINIAEQQIVSARPDTSMAATSSFSEDGKKAIATLGVRFDWLNDLPSIYQEFGLVEASQFKPDPIPALRPMSSYLAIGGWEEFSYNVLDKKGAHPLLGSGQDLRRRLNDVRNETQTGAAIEQLH
ncbi:uncharacterized protein ATNIH1004_005722 [Aspergillus tanneri]|uniref:Methyltransferase type 11 domain-containing protein n=1 Tax=Aspergillus tanneri TaxID=1220188 RepID=A0A5M9MR65_9EURO|nr:uncharacterized protein ATNIH1004_005722 [Aspergillus tanneri]KAA8647039.1 hypothetical protein ATNIH1004_005722 [Aspergillus tanneri]